MTMREPATPRPRIAASVRQAGTAALNLLLPPRCALCEAPVEVNFQLCATCFNQTTFVTEPCCARCGVPFANASQASREGQCVICEAVPPEFDQARAALRYDSQGRRLILPFKHADRQELAGVLAPMMARAGAMLLRRADVLVPVPLHRRRLFQRRYNQAALLTRILARTGQRPALLDALARIRPTEALGDKSAAERTLIVADAFRVRPGRIAGIAARRVLMIDDVMTSGATANACAAALLAAGATAVDVLVAARVPDPRLG